MKKDFSKITLHSKLFKGRADWYFCYLKTEKIANVCEVLAGRSSPSSEESLKELSHSAAHVVGDVLYVAAGETPEEALLASLFSTLSKLRLSAAGGHISRETARILIEEYEGVIERIVGDSRHLGLTLTSQDLAVPAIAEEPLFTPLPSLAALPSLKDIKDINKGHNVPKALTETVQAVKGHQRTGLILDFVQKNKGVSIKEIAMVIRDCSEKTIQRELNTMIERGLVKRQGERRWSTYHPV